MFGCIAFLHPGHFLTLCLFRFNSDIITPDHMPYIGKLKDNMYIGVGYNTWGMTNGVLAAKIITDNILDIENEYKNSDELPLQLERMHIFYCFFVKIF